MGWTDYFEHATREAEIYRQWEESGAFHADVSSNRPAFTISMPPPNATGSLHLGHAIMVAIEDLLIRWRRMSGYEALWLPGTDHAAIASESRMISELQKSGIKDPRTTLGREELIRRIAEFVENSRGRIRSQIRSMGASCDWARERYTMDSTLTRCVASTFARMFRDGLIYRGPRIINWDPALQTTISDDEIEHIEHQAKFYTIQYGPFQIGTSRPETKLGDTGVAVHPDDPRWKEFIGQSFEIQWPKGPKINVQVIADAQHVDVETGTGAIGLTPAHSMIDFEIAQAHNLPLVQVIGEDGRMTEAAGPYAGMTVMECRQAFVQDLRDAGLLLKEEDYIQPLSICYRSKQPIEPLPKDQWFIDVNKPAVRWRGMLLSLRQVLKDVVESNEIEIIPAYEKKKYFHWIDNLRDWSISRQIWWGHRIPVWYRGPEECYVGYKKPEGDGWEQDPDTLDTWFSSALWTWATLIDPELVKEPDLDLKLLMERSPDFVRFHPTTVMETGYDILFFWVARMIMMTTYATGQVPFRTIYLHGLILDEDGEKMTKTKPEKCIDPVDEIRESGADPLRLAMILGGSAGRDTRLSKAHISACKRLVNKLWNAAKLVDRNTAELRDSLVSSSLMFDTLEHPINRWMLGRMDILIEEVNSRLEIFSLNEAAERVRTSFWGEFCDFYLEATKSESLAQRDETAKVLLYVFEQYLKLFHPFMPFVTEEIWQNLNRPGLLINQTWPIASQKKWPDDIAGVDAIIRLISEIRRIRSDREIEPKTKVNVVLQPSRYHDIFETGREVIQRLARTLELTVDPSTSEVMRKDASVAVDPVFTAAVTLGQDDLDAERVRLTKQLKKEQERLDSLAHRLNDNGFVSRAPVKVVDSTRVELENAKITIDSIQKRLDFLNGH